MSKIKKNNDLKDKKKIKTNLSVNTETNVSNKNIFKNIFKDIFPILPLIILVFFLPFVIRLKLIPLEGPFYDYWTGERVNADFFTYYKKIFIYLVTIWTMIHTFFFTKKIKRTKAYYFMGGYALLVILSTTFSDYPQIALHGFNERHEGMWIVLCYILLIFSTINLVTKESQIKALIYSLGISGGVISLIAIFQFFGMDIFDTELMTNLMIPREIISRLEEISIKFGEGYSYGVFYNPNYLGGYISLYAPLMFTYMIYTKNLKEKIVFGILSFLSILALLFSRSEAGVLGTLISLIIIIFFFVIKHLIHNKSKDEYNRAMLKGVIPIALITTIATLLISYIPMSTNPLARIRNEAFELLGGDAEKLNYREIGPLNNIFINEDGEAEIKINNQEIMITSNGTNVILSDFENEEIYNRPISEKVENLSVGAEKYENLLITTYVSNSEDISSIELNFVDYGNMKLYFMIRGNDISISNSTFRDIEITEAPYIGFHGKGQLGSNRGYIWSRSFPLLFDNLLIGSGQDTFITQFPQYDIYAKQVEVGPAYWQIWEIVDKPHSLYLQIGIHSGILALIIFIVGIGISIFNGIKLYLIKNDFYSLALSSSILGFLISSIFNDSIIAITPIVMILLGLLISRNISLKDEI
ncbi:O-antigen ligase [Acetoanaerobium pronyense]|uniref:O-antigen ligase n=1 Tax=Acetoanaerobium pronyense TaxID=1482736 RepID=A0ABS4KH74_9FIRM|nr:O-antigen ligase family protein [Acetoanaerobium pronyense]MBP2027129.1 O-antigen ligase [Acetoanaerobium pronyense]